MCISEARVRDLWNIVEMFVEPFRILCAKRATLSLYTFFASKGKDQNTQARTAGVVQACHNLLVSQTGFQQPGFWITMVGFRIPLAGFQIPKPWIPDSTDQNYLDSGFRITLHGAKIQFVNECCTSAARYSFSLRQMRILRT